MPSNTQLTGWRRMSPWCKSAAQSGGVSFGDFGGLPFGVAKASLLSSPNVGNSAHRGVPPTLVRHCTVAVQSGSRHSGVLRSGRVPDALAVSSSRSPTLRNTTLLGLPSAGRLHTGQRRHLVRLHRLYPVRDGSLCGEAASCCVRLADLFVGWLPKWILKSQTAAYFARPSCQRIRRIIAMSETRHV